MMGPKKFRRKLDRMLMDQVKLGHIYPGEEVLPLHLIKILGEFDRKLAKFK